MQLDLFADAPVFYHRAMEALGRVDAGACRALLDEHARRFPRGPDASPVREAAAWLDLVLPKHGDSPASFGAGLLAACRALREGRAGGFRVLGGDAARAALRSLARQGLERARRAGIDPSSPLAEGLPWGVFFFLADAAAEAQAALEAFLARSEPTAAAYLALGDALLRQGKERPGRLAYREGFLLDPTGQGWPIECRATSGACRRLSEDPDWGPAWWAVGAYVEGAFERYGGATVGEVLRRWERFRCLCASGGEGKEAEARLFGCGLALVENTEVVLTSRRIDLLLVRRKLLEVNKRAWERLRDTLASGGGRRR